MNESTSTIYDRYPNASPYADEPEVECQCDCCGRDLYEGDNVYEVSTRGDAGSWVFCEDCVIYTTL